MKWLRLLFVIGVSSLISSCIFVPKVSEVRLSTDSVILKVGESITLTATVEPKEADYDVIVWTSSDPTIASVENGKIIANKVGTANITASVEGVSSRPCVVAVQAVLVSSITLDHSSVELLEGESLKLNATVTPSNATDQ